MDKTRVSIVSYLNSKPFLFGLKKSDIASQIDMTLDIPAKVAAKLDLNLADIGLIPVAGLDDLNDYNIVSDFCIGSIGKVRTVILASEVPLEQMETILMDYQSRSSVTLTKILAEFYWKRTYQWKSTCANFHLKSIKGNTAGIVIGDRVFDIENRYPYIYDLSEEWYNFTRLPFVFAVWAANKKLNPEFEKDFNKALSFGIDKIAEIEQLERRNYPGVDIFNYFTKNISFKLDERKREGMTKFLELAKKLETVKIT